MTADRHKVPTLRFRAPEPERLWLLAYKQQTGKPMNAILTEAVRKLRAEVEGKTMTSLDQTAEAAHFPGCHPEDAEDTRQTPNPIPETEPCWHCGIPTTRGTCGCADCWDGDDYVPVSSVYHCPTCKRWWAYMIPRITKITFNSKGER